MRHAASAALFALLLVVPLAPAAAQSATRPVSASAGGEPSLEAVRAAAERFRDVAVALREGYVRDPMNMCVTAEIEGRPASDGAMGIHFLRPDLLKLAAPGGHRVHGAGTHTDFLRPAILIYEPQIDGGLELVAVENLVFQEAWEAAGNRRPPVFHGLAWDRMADDPATPQDEAHGFAPHFDRHVWLFRENPRGIFEPYNPRVTCRHHRGG